MSSTIISADGLHPVDAMKLQLEHLEFAGCNLDRFICSDNSRPSFLEITGITQQRSPTCSGLNTGDYRNLKALLNHPNVSLLKIINKVPLPAEIMEHFAHMQCNCLMGVFPEIGRVWLAIDSNIYAWSYENGSDVAYYDSLNESIVSVGLIKPKPKVFQNFIKYLLVLTTTLEITVLGVSFACKNEGDSEFEEMHLLPEPIFQLATNGVALMSVKSSANGRIFMGGRDGCLYELEYQAQLGWFGKQCKKVNHSTSALSFLVPSFINSALYDEDPIVMIEVDNSRNILYTLSEKGCIEVFYLGNNGESTTKVMRLTQNNIVNHAMDIVTTLETYNFKPVVSISAVDESESEHLNLVAVTQTGVRLYFSAGIGNAQNPHKLALLHVRLPPGFTSDAQVFKPKQVYNAVYECGTLVMVCSGSGSDAETLWCLSRSLPGGGLSEAHSLIALDGPAWALTALPPQHEPKLSPALLAKRGVWSVSRWAVVTGSGACVLQVGAAPDLLRSLLIECRGPEALPVRDFFQLYSLEQACACAVYLACEDTNSSDLTVSEWATRAFYIFGNVASHTTTNHNQTASMSPVVGTPKFAPRSMSTPVSIRGPQGQIHHGKSGQPYQTPNSPLFPGSVGMSTPPMNLTAFNHSSFNVTQQPRDPNYTVQVEYSARHNGLFIYVGRILAPIWNLKCVEKSMTPDNKEFMVSQITGDDCSYVVQRLQRVSAFMQRVGALPQTEEHASLTALKHFISMAIEMLNLWKVLSEHQFHVVAASLPPDQQSALQAASFRELLVGGQEVAGLLLASLVAGYLRDNASVDGISRKLRQLCPTLYRQEDATCSKAHELLIFAKQQKNPAEKEEMLEQALKLCVDVAPNVNLPLVCSKLLSVGFCTGVVELCCACASKIDPQDKALHFYKIDQPSLDREGHFMYYRRMEIYREVCNALERLYERSGEQSNSDNTMVLSSESNYQGRKLLWDCLLRHDELLHVAVYEWLISKNLGSELLALGPAPPSSLRTYLQAAARSSPPPTAIILLDLLWKVLEKSGEHLAAAEVLEGLATTPGSGATLAQRMSWLSAGVVCVRGAGAGGGELLRRLEEAGEVARVQCTVRAHCLALPRALQPPPRALKALDDELLEITQLYENYADRYNLWECKLAIVQCSGHNDTLLVETIWSNMITEGEATAKHLPMPEERMAAVLAKITTLGREYANTGHCFPIYFIIRQLEILSCKMQVSDESMVFKTFLKIGISLEQVLDIYIKLVTVNERVWLGFGNDTHVCACAAALLETACSELAPLPSTKRRRCLARCKDLHECAVSALQARPNTQLLIERISVAQAHLDRMD